jgi:hypothetical protein
MKTRREVRCLAAVCLLACAAFGAYHFYLRGVMLGSGLRLGAVRPGSSVYRIVPLYIHARPRLKTGVLIAAAVVTVFIWWLRRRLMEAESLPAARNGTQSVLGGTMPAASPSGRRFAVAASFAAWQMAIAVAVALIDGGIAVLWKPYQEYQASDYIGAVERIESPGAFLRDYPRLMPGLPLHCRHHPPGGPLVLWCVAQLFGPGPFAASLATIALAGLAAPAVYFLAGEVLHEGGARLAAALFVLAPNVVSYSATCMDAVFMVPLVWSFFFLYRGRRLSPLAHGIAGGVTAALAALMTFSASFVALWAIVLLVVTALFDRTRLRNVAVTLAAAVAAALVFYGVLYAVSGYEPSAVLRQAFAGQDEVMKGRGHSSLRQSAHFAVANLVAFLFCSGLPVVWWWARQTGLELRRAASGPARWLLISFCATLLLVDVAPLYTLETERIWIFLVGFLAIGAAAWLARDGASLAASRLVLATLAIEAGQTIVMEVLFEWRW